MNRFVIADPRQCIGCNTCMAACSDVHAAQGLLSRPRLTVTRVNGQTAPMLCRQCDDAPCARVCPVEAITLADDAVVLNESLCIGCKLCGLACPFGAITPTGSTPLNVPSQYLEYVAPHKLADVPQSPASMPPFLAWNAGVRMVAAKCDLCAFLSDGPSCVRTCPTQALHLVDGTRLEATVQTAQLREAQRLAQVHSAMPGSES